MNSENISNEIESSPPPPIYEEDEINLLDILLVVLKYKKIIISISTVTFIMCCIISLLSPNIYTSTARILPPQEQNSGGISSALSSVSSIASLAGFSLGGGGSSEQYMGLLKSRTIADSIIDKFDLMHIYDQKYRVKTYNELEKRVSIKLGDDDNIIEISVEDEDPKRATKMANTYVEELKKLNVRLNLGTAGRERLFLENRLSSVKTDLVKAEEDLKSFQETNKAIRIDDQATAIIDAIANLKSKIANKEVELGVLLSYQTDQNPQVRALKEAISQLKSQLVKLEETPSDQQTSTDIFMATSEVPELGLQYARLLRNFKVQETLYELLTQQYETAKISEARDTSTIEVIDEAIVPDRKTKPKRTFIVISGTFIAFIFSFVFVLFLDFSQRIIKNDPNRWQQILNYLPFRKKRRDHS